MNNFLKQFEDNNYKKDEPNILKEVVEEKPYENTNRLEHKIAGPEHEFILDTNYQKAKTVKVVIISITIIAVILLIGLFLRLSNQVTVKKLVGMRLNDVEAWGIKNKIEFNIETTYSLEYNENIIISQSVAENKKIQKGSVIDIEVSLGADPNERITIPALDKMTYSEIQGWITSNKLNNTYVMQEYNELEAGTFLRMEFVNAAINGDNFTRKDRLNIYVSRGPEPVNKNVTVPDFLNKSKAEIETWASANEIEIIFKEKVSSSVPKGFAISQSVAAGTKIYRTDKITVEISLGKASIVPNFNNISKEEAQSIEGFHVVVKTAYSNTVSYGKLISQSVKAGSSVIDENAKIEVVYSDGRPFIDNLVGMSEKDLPAYFYGFNSKGCNITYRVTYVDSDQDKSTVVTASKSLEFVNTTTVIDITISKGNL